MNTDTEYRYFNTLVDWLRFSVPETMEPENVMPQHAAFAPTGEFLDALPNYTSTYATVCARLDWNVDRPSQRMLVTMTGKDLERMRGLGMTDQDLLRHIVKIPGHKFTRLDVACDSTDTRISPAEAAKDYQSGRLSTMARSMSEITKTGNSGEYQGHTVYIGSRTSEQYLRVYDKAAEQQTEGHLTRVELELKGNKATEAAMHIIAHGIDRAATGVFSRFFTWKNAGWLDLIGGNAIPVSRIAVDEPDKREEWLRRVAVPAVIAAIKSGNTNVKEQIFRELKLVARNINLTQY